MVGYHSRAQGRGILAHTINNFAFDRVSFNGTEMGEAGIYGALAGEHGAAVVMASGDDAFIEQHRPLFPGVVFMQTKRAGARPLRLQVPVEVRIQTQTPALADLFCQWPELRRLACDEVALQASAMSALLR